MLLHTPKISVLIPVYNAERFLAECLDSVLAQTYGDFEIICADDASTDNSLNMLRQYASRDNRVHILHNARNAGTALTRNLLLQKASGQYIAFIDADDFILPTYLEHLYNTAQNTNADIVRSLYTLFNITDHSQIPCEKKYKEFLHPVPDNSPKQRLQAALDDSQVWLKLIKTSLIREHDISFLPHQSAEDISFEILLYQYASKIVFTDQHLYFYRAGNLKTSSSNKDSLAVGILSNMIFLCQNLPKRHLTQTDLYNSIVKLTFHAIRRMRKFSSVCSGCSLCRQGFIAIQQHLQYCTRWNRFKYTCSCRLAEHLPDKMLPYLAYWIR